MKISLYLNEHRETDSKPSTVNHNKLLLFLLIITFTLYFCYFYMGGGSSKSDMAAPIIVKETERHIATVSELCRYIKF